MRRRLGITQADVATRMGVTQSRVSGIEHARPGASGLRTLAAYVEALGGRLEIIADFGDQRLAFAEPSTTAA
jgi:transcriptional regulator with XRE-family HTH domain